MINSSRKSPKTCVRFSIPPFLLGMAAILMLSVNAVRAQDKTPALTATSEKAPNSATAYQTSLDSLSTLYKNKVEALGKQIAEANKPAPVVSLADAASTTGISNESWSTGNMRIDGLIRLYGNQYGVDPYLIYCLMSQESKFASSATSPKGAQGLMQLMPGTAARYGVTNPYDVAQSIMGGTRYLKDLLLMFNGRVDLALAGYNAGENAVIKYGYTVPPYDETRNYVKLIVKRYGRITTNNKKAKS